MSLIYQMSHLTTMRLKYCQGVLRLYKHQRKLIVGSSSNPAGTMMLRQCCHNVTVDVVTTLFHGRK